MGNSQKYCKHCGQLIDADCIVCPKCGKQVEQLQNQSSPIVINNSASSSANATAFNSSAVITGKAKNKWVAFFLCLFTICGHKFYEGKPLVGLFYFFTCGIFGLGWIIDLISLLMKQNPYYV